MSLGISICDRPRFEELRREFRVDPLLVRKLRIGLLKKFLPDEAALADFPGRERIAVHPLTLFRRMDSAHDGASKLLFQTAGGMLVESVILRVSSGRTALCVSSQIGCAAACDFCATGKMGIARNLTAEEIVDQVLQAGQMLALEGRAIRNIVFMGMGEPFHNEEQLHRALELLTAPDLFHHAATRLLVSTVGIPDAMLRCMERFPSIHLALSLHSVRSSVRESLIPMARKHPLPELRETIVELNRRFGSTVMIEYLMLAGINDSAEDANELLAWLDGLKVHVNLIPYNPIEDAPHLQGSDRLTRERFAGQLKEAGLKVTTRYSLGNDIAAACGQLVRHENRSRAMVPLERPTP